MADSLVYFDLPEALVPSAGALATWTSPGGLGVAGTVRIGGSARSRTTATATPPRASTATPALIPAARERLRRRLPLERATPADIAPRKQRGISSEYRNEDEI